LCIGSSYVASLGPGNRRSVACHGVGRLERAQCVQQCLSTDQISFRRGSAALLIQSRHLSHMPTSEGLLHRNGQVCVLCNCDGALPQMLHTLLLALRGEVPRFRRGLRITEAPPCVRLACEGRFAPCHNSVTTVCEHQSANCMAWFYWQCTVWHDFCEMDSNSALNFFHIQFSIFAV